MPGTTETIFFLVRVQPFLWPLLSLFCWFCGCPSTQAAQLHLMPPPLSVTCAKPENRVYQQQDHPFQVSCLWDRYVVLHYSKAPKRNPNEGGTESPMPPLCHWYRDAILVNWTTSWTGELMLDPGLSKESPHPPGANIRILVQCISVSCLAPLCLYHNLSIEVVGQDIHLFQLHPRMLPLLERQPVHLGWCARLKSSAWSYHFKSQGGLPEDLLIPTNQHNEPLQPSDYPSAELYQVCTSYYSYHLTVQYPLRGTYIASVSYKPGPQSSLSLDFSVEPALLFVFRVTSQLQRQSPGALSFSWNLQQLSPEIVAYHLLDTRGSLEWTHSYHYNPFGLHSCFCTVPASHQTKETVVTRVYFRTSQRISERGRGRLEFSNRTLIFRTSRTSSVSIRLNPQENTISTYIFSRAQGLYYSTQKGNLPHGLAENSSLCYILYQQAGLSYLITVKFVQLQLFRFSLDIYLNRKEALFQSLGEKEMDLYVFNSTSPENSLAYVVWFIPVQHPLLQCEWAFDLQVFDSVGGRLLKNYSFAYNDQTRNTARFLPDSALAFHPASYAGFVARVKCTKSAKIPIVFTARFNIYTLKVIESQIACQQKTCTIPKVKIHRAANTRHILHYAQGTGFTLAADMQVSCPGSKATKVSWNIYKVSDLSKKPDWSKPFNPPGIEGRHFIRLKVSCSSLDTGLYLFNFTVQLISFTFAQKIEHSDAVLIEVGSDRWGAVISGDHFRSVGFSDRWILKGSVLSNGELVSLSQGLSYTWYCTKQETDYTSMTLSRDGKCYPDQVDLKWTTSSDPIQVVLPETLQANNTYHFLLVVQNGSRIAQAQQTIHVRAHGALILNIACIENCGAFVIPTERFSLSGKCGNCREVKSWYYWSLHSAQSHEIIFDWSSRTTTGRSSSYLHFKAFALVSMAEESYILSLKVITKGGQSSSCEYSFYVNAPPQTGKCVINPRKGVAFLTKFIIQCHGFEDRNQPLVYKVIAGSDQMTISSISSIQNNTLGIIVYAGHESKTPWSFLPPGRPSQNSALTVYVQVFNTLGAYSQVTLQATVLDQRQPTTNAILHQQLNDLINGSNALMTKLFITKDYLSLGYIVYMVASALNKIEASPANRVPKTDLRQLLLNITTRIPSSSIGGINQAVLSICQVTLGIAEVNKVSQLLAVRKLKRVSEALKRHRNQGLSSKETEILSNGILTGLSNILDASLLNHRNPNADAIKEAISVTEILADLILEGKVPGEHETKMAARNWSIHLWKDKTQDVSGTFSNRKQCQSCFYPKLKQGPHVDLEDDHVVSTILYEFEQSPFPWLTFADNIGTMVTGFKMVGTDSKRDLTTIVPDAFEMILARKDKAIFELTIGPDKKLPKTTGGFSLEIERNSSDIFIQLVPKVKVTFQVFIYLGLNLSHPPLVLYNASHLSPPTVIQKDTIVAGCALQVPYVLCLPKSLLWSPAYNRGADTLNLSIVLQSHPIVRDQTAKALRIAVFAAGCLALEGIQDQWEEETCSLGSQTSWSKIHCVCKAKKQSTRPIRSGSSGASGPGIQFLAGKLLLFPNQVDMKAFLLEQSGENPVPGLIVLAVFLIYIFLAVWVRKKDRIDIEEQIIDLPDNDPFHTMKYLVTIYTGSRPHSGTKADVFIELIGQNGSSDVHLLKHPSFPEILQNSCIDTFMLTTEEDLGDLFSIHIWHNYCGFGPNWYVSRIKVFNVDTNRSWLFLCRKWLAIGRRDYQIEWTFEVTDPQVPISRIDYLLIMLSYHWFQDHLWFSIFVRSLDSSWNRFQRLSCCLAILLTSLLVNTLIFNIKKEEQMFLLQLQYLKAIIAGVLSGLMSIPIEWITVGLFRYSVKRLSQSDTTQGQGKESFTCVPKSLPNIGTQFSEIKSQQLSATDINFSNNYATAKKETFGKTQKFQWGRCLSGSVWLFVFLVTGVASFFTTFIGLSFDNKTSTEWLIAALVSFCLHVSFFETLQIVIYSSWNICFAKYCADIPWQGYEDMEYSSTMMEADEMVKLHHDLVELRASKKYQPIKEEDVTALQKKKMIQYLAYKYIKDMICHFVFLFLIFAVSHPIDISTSYFYNHVMSRAFSPDLPDLNGAQDIYRWVNDSFLPLIHNPYYPSYLLNTWSKILGLPRMRQIRRKSVDLCVLPHELKYILLLHNVYCLNKYGYSQEDQTNYLDSWSTPTDTSVPKNHAEFLGFSYEPSSTQWDYTSQGKLNEYPSRGYTFYFFPEEPQVNSTKRLEALETKSWIDNKTWAVILELTTFNVDVHAFCSVSVIFELSLLGPVNASVSVHSYMLPLFTHQNMSQIFFFCLSIYILIIYIADECRMVYRYRLNYFTLATNLINFGIKTVCILFLVVLLCKFKLSSDLVEFYLLHSKEFIPFHTASQFDQTVRGVLGVLVFFLVLKTYRYARFLFDLRLAQKSLNTALPGIINLLVMGAIFFSAFTALGYMGFGQYERNFRSLMHSFTTLLSYCTLSFKNTEFLADRLLGGLFLGSFLLVMICIFVNLSQVIMMSAHSDMKEVVFNEASNEAEVMYFILQKVYRMWYFARTGTYTIGETDLFNTVLFGKFKKRRKPPLRKRLGRKERIYVVI